MKKEIRKTKAGKKARKKQAREIKVRKKATR